MSVKRKKYEGVLTTQVVISLDPFSLVDHANTDQLFGFITDIDDALADWQFTLKLYEYFANLKAEYDDPGRLLVLGLMILTLIFYIKFTRANSTIWTRTLKKL